MLWSLSHSQYIYIYMIIIWLLYMVIIWFIGWLVVDLPQYMDDLRGISQHQLGVSMVSDDPKKFYVTETTYGEKL